MFIFTKIANTVLIVVSIILVIFLSALSITLYTTLGILDDSNSVKEIVHTNEIRNAYKSYLISSQSETQLGIDESEINSLSTEEINSSIDFTIDSIYNWLEGNEDTPSIILDSTTESEGLIKEKHLEERIGILAQFVDYDKLNNEIEEQVPLLEFDPTLSEVLPETYNKLEKWFQYSVAALFVVSLLLLFSGRKVRGGIFYLGVAYSLGALLILIGPGYIENNPEKLNSINWGILQIPEINDPSGFLKGITIEVFKEIMIASRKYAYLLFGSGIVLIILSQIGIRRREIELEDENEEENNEESNKEDGPEIIIA